MKESKNKNVRGKSRRKAKVESGQGREIKSKFQEERKQRLPPIQAMNDNQKRYFQVLRTEKLIIASGAAGTGKTFIPCALAADAFLRGDIEKIIIARPPVEMGKSIGFRKGTELEKLEPFLRPMLDTIKKRVGCATYEIMLSTKQLEIQSLDAIRGRSFDEPCLVLVDEGQNCEPSEIRSIVTRIGADCQMVLCGDPDQTDIKGLNGMQYITNIVNKYTIPDTALITFTEDDIVRSPMAKEFVIAFRKEKEVA